MCACLQQADGPSLALGYPPGCITLQYVSRAAIARELGYGEGSYVTRCIQRGAPIRERIYKALEENMEDVINKQCERCSKQPSFGYYWRRPLRCADHREEDMEDVVNKQCEQCSKQPSFGYQWMRPLRCCDHKEEGMENVVSKQCEQCSKQPGFGYIWMCPLRCYDHKDSDMNDVIHQQCERCSKRPSLGFEWMRPLRCADHREDHMKNVVGKPCERCSKQPSFGYIWMRPLRCADHREEHMENVVGKQCECCSKQSSFGYIWMRPLRCADHKEGGMEDVRNKRCEHGRRLCYCRGSICHINNIGTRSVEEMFPDATAYVFWSGGDDLPAFLLAINQRFRWKEVVMPDMVVEHRAFFHDGHYYHLDKPKDARDTLALTEQGYQVVRTRDRLPAVEGALNIVVDATRGVEEMCHTLATALGVDEASWPALWRRVDSLARRAVMQLGQQYAQVKQSLVTDFFTGAQ